MRPHIPTEKPAFASLRTAVDATMLLAVTFLVAAALAACGNPVRSGTPPVRATLAACDSLLSACPVDRVSGAHR